MQPFLLVHEVDRHLVDSAVAHLMEEYRTCSTRPDKRAFRLRHVHSGSHVKFYFLLYDFLRNFLLVLCNQDALRLQDVV